MNSQTLKLSVVLVGLILLSWPCQIILAYDNLTTHPALTEQAIDFYNSLNPKNPITDEQKNWVIQGSILEDTAPRWVNHFYDPLYKDSWTGELAGRISSSTMMRWAMMGFFMPKPAPAPQWINDQKLQKIYSRYGGNHTWQKALEDYADGNLKESFQSLGYVLHVLEDMSVPDHTRNDTHVHELWKLTGDYGSPYEEYLKKYNRETIKKLHLLDSLKNSGAGLVNFDSIENYLISLATYSNKYFFSKDTVMIDKYRSPQIINDDGRFAYGLDENGEKFPLAAVKNSGYYLPYPSSKADKQKEAVIIEAYFERLSKQAILHAAGALNLFLEEAEKEKARRAYPLHSFNSAFSLASLFSNFLKPPAISLIGETMKTAYLGRPLVRQMQKLETNSSSDEISDGATDISKTIATTTLPISPIISTSTITIATTATATPTAIAFAASALPTSTTIAPTTLPIAFTYTYTYTATPLTNAIASTSAAAITTISTSTATTATTIATTAPIAIATPTTTILSDISTYSIPSATSSISSSSITFLTASSSLSTSTSALILLITSSTATSTTTALIATDAPPIVAAITATSSISSTSILSTPTTSISLSTIASSSIFSATSSKKDSHHVDRQTEHRESHTASSTKIAFRATSTAAHILHSTSTQPKNKSKKTKKAVSYIAEQTDESAMEKIYGANNIFYQYLESNLTGEPESFTFRAKFHNVPHLISAEFFASSEPDYRNSQSVSYNTCYIWNNEGLPYNIKDGNCPNLNFQADIAQNYIIPIEQPFVFDPAKYYKVKIHAYHSYIMSIYGSTNGAAYVYGKAATNPPGRLEEIPLDLQSLYFLIPSKNSVHSPALKLNKMKPQNFHVDYSTSSLELSLSWLPPRHASSGLNYKIADVSQKPILPTISTTATSAKISVREVGRHYKFHLWAEDTNGNKTSEVESRDILVPFSLADKYIIAQQTDGSIAERAGSFGPTFYQDLGKGLKGKLGAVAIKIKSPDDVLMIDIGLDRVAYCVSDSAVTKGYEPGPLCSHYYLGNNIWAIPAKNNFAFDKAKKYKINFTLSNTYDLETIFFGSAKSQSYPRGKSSKLFIDGRSAPKEIPTSAIKNLYFILLSSTPLR